MTKQGERLNRILQILRMQNPTTVNTLADMLDVSHMTIRRDLGTLEKQGLVETFHGGVLLKEEVGDDTSLHKYSVSAATTRNIDEKMRIGMQAAGLVKPEDCLILDSGSTIEHLARCLPDAIPLTIICFTLNSLIEVAKRKNSRIIFAGGYFHSNSLMFESSQGLELIKMNRASVAFVSASGISSKLGVTCSNPYERETKRAIMESSLKRILISDSSKFNTVQSTYFADLEEFDVLITDKGMPESYIEICRQHGIELYLV